MHALLATALICSVVSGAQPVAVSTTDLVKADNKFGLEVFSSIAASRPQQNVFISPLSIALALQMTALGAAGATADVMADAMNLSGHSMSEVAVSNLELREQLANPGKDVRLDVANSLWLRAGVNLQKQYTEDCSRYYNAPVTILDFGGTGAATAINNWVAKNTAGRIKQIVSELEPKEFLVLVNAIYFKGSWTKPFDTKLTSPREFHLIKGSVLRRMMNREGKFRYRADSTMQAVALPYGTQRLSMYIFLPRDNDGLVKFIDALKPDSVAGLFVGLGERKGTVVLPRFKIEFEQDLNGVLAQLGMGQAFTPAADFSGMVAPPDPVAISDVLHKTLIEVNEEGTEAAAATGVTMVAGAAPPPEKKFSLVCDHPFLCAIRDDETGSVLFLGAIYDPKQ